MKTASEKAKRRWTTEPELKKTRVIDPEGTPIGYVENLLINLSTGQIAYLRIVIPKNGSLQKCNFSTDNTTTRLIPWAAFHYEAENREFILRAHLSTLQSMRTVETDTKCYLPTSI